MPDNQIKVQITAEDLYSAVMRGLQDGMSKVSASVKASNDAIKDSTKETTSTMGELFKGLGRGSFYLNQITEAVKKTAEVLMMLAAPAMEMEKLTAQFKAASGSSELAAKDMKFVRDESSRLGLSFSETAGAFSKFAASTRNTSVEGDKAKQIFTAVAEASTALRLSTDETSGILLAFSQMLGKGKVSAEELNQVAERLPGALDVISSSMGMTTTEFRAAAEAGRVLSAEVLGKLPAALHALYGDAASEAANSTAAQLSRLKNAVFELMAAMGSGPMAIVAGFASALASIAEVAKSALDWIGNNLWNKGLSAISAGFAALAVSLGLTALGFAAYTVATSAAAAATWAFTASLLSNPVGQLFLAAGAAVVGLVAGVRALSDAYLSNGDATAKSSKAIKQNTEEARRSAAERKEIEDGYEKAVGISVERQLSKRKIQYDADHDNLKKKLGRDLEEAQGNETKRTAISEQYNKDRLVLENNYSRDVIEIRNKRLQDEQKAAQALIEAHTSMLKSIGKLEEASAAEVSASNQQRRKEIVTYYENKIAAAKAAGQVLVGVEAEQAAAVAELDKRFMREAELRGWERRNKALQLSAALVAAETAIVEEKVRRNELTETQGSLRIVALQVEQLQKEKAIFTQRVESLAAAGKKDTEEYRVALNDQARAQGEHTKLLEANYKKYSDKIKEIEKSIADYQLSIQEKIRNLKQKGMTDEQKQADDLKRYKELLAAADTAQYMKKTKEALEYNSKAEELAVKLGEAQVKGIDNVRVGTEALKEVERQRLIILEEQKDEAKKSLNQVKEIADQRLDPKKLEIQLDEAAVNRVNEEMARLTRTETKTIMIETIGPSGDSRYTNYQVPGMAVGGFVGGSGIGDTQLRALDPREFVLNPQATSALPSSFLNLLNNPLSAAGRDLVNRISGFTLPAISTPAPSFAMANGGGVGTLPDMGSITINVGGGSFPVMGEIDVLKLLKTALRREQLTRQQ